MCHCVLSEETYFSRDALTYFYALIYFFDHHDNDTNVTEKKALEHHKKDKEKNQRAGRGSAVTN